MTRQPAGLESFTVTSPVLAVVPKSDSDDRNSSVQSEHSNNSGMVEASKNFSILEFDQNCIN